MTSTSFYRQSNLLVVLCSNNELLARKLALTVSLCLLQQQGLKALDTRPIIGSLLPVTVREAYKFENKVCDAEYVEYMYSHGHQCVDD